jgi:hypothetical protein
MLFRKVGINKTTNQSHTSYILKKFIHQIMPIFALEEITKVPKAMMQWANYWHNIVQHYHVICEGWPAHILFKHLSEASTSLPKLQMLHDMWKNKLISWRLLDEDEYQWLLQEHNKKVNTGEIVESSCWPHSDKGKKHI